MDRIIYNLKMFSKVLNYQFRYFVGTYRFHSLDEFPNLFFIQLSLVFTRCCYK